MDTKKIVIRLKADGTMTTDAHGFTGASCLEKTSELVKGLGAVVSERKKAEFYLEETAGVDLHTAW